MGNHHAIHWMNTNNEDKPETPPASGNRNSPTVLVQTWALIQTSVLLKSWWHQVCFPVFSIFVPLSLLFPLKIKKTITRNLLCSRAIDQNRLSARRLYFPLTKSNSAVRPMCWPGIPDISVRQKWPTCWSESSWSGVFNYLWFSKYIIKSRLVHFNVSFYVTSLGFILFCGWFDSRMHYKQDMSIHCPFLNATYTCTMVQLIFF